MGIEDPLQVWDEITEDFQALRTQLNPQIGHPGDVAAGPGKALHQTQLHRIFYPGKDNRNLGGRLLCCLGRLRSRSKDKVYPILYQFAGSDGQGCNVTLGKADAEDKILVFVIA